MRIMRRLLLAAIAPKLLLAATWFPVFLDEYPHAVCNDGSPAAYYYREGDPSRRQWLVFLEGAGWCWDVKSCSLSWHMRLGTSVEFPRTPQAVANWAKDLEGIFEMSRSPLRDLNIAYIRTCSNDAFMGDTGPRVHGHTPGLSWHFRGRRVIDATFADLRAKRGLGGQAGDQVIYGGCSSGARGAMVSLDYVAEQLAGKATVRGLLDSGLWVPINPRNNGLVSFNLQTEHALQLMRPPPEFLGRECLGEHIGEAWKCLEGAFRFPFLQTPFFLTHSQYDLFAISMNVFGHFLPSAKLDDAQQHYADSYRALVVKYLPTPVMGSGTTIYSSACYAHCTLTSKAMYVLRADGVTLRDALQRWFTAPDAGTATRWIRDRCGGFDCGRGEALLLDEMPASAGAAAQAVAPREQGTWEPHFLEEYPLAICNDGSPAAYYYRTGPPRSRQWLVFLEGAGWCWDSISCSHTWKVRLGTSVEYPRTPTAVAAWAALLRGIFDGGPFMGWHVAYVRSCSNDAFLGDASPSAQEERRPGPGWHFRGRRILEATFADLRRHAGLGDQEGDMVIYGGCSSGGRGALVTLDLVRESLAGKANVVGLLDAPLWVPVQPFNAQVVSFEDQTRAFFTLANASILVQGPCGQAYAKEPWRCLFPALRLPFVRTPYFLAHSQYDVFGITMNIFGRFMPGRYLPPAEKRYAEHYREEVLHYLPKAGSSSGVTVFSPACYVHCVCTEPVYEKIDSDGVLLPDALQRWLTAESAEVATQDLRDSCSGFNCGLGRQHSSKHHSVAGRAVPSPTTTTTWLPKRPLLEEVAGLLV